MHFLKQALEYACGYVLAHVCFVKKDDGLCPVAWLTGLLVMQLLASHMNQLTRLARSCTHVCQRILI